jgi:cysteine synthase B
MKFNNILETIGGTPLVRINRIWNQPAITIWAKLEGCNPMGSVKERPALYMIEGAEKEGMLKKGMMILNPPVGGRN